MFTQLLLTFVGGVSVFVGCPPRRLCHARPGIRHRRGAPETDVVGLWEIEERPRALPDTATTWDNFLVKCQLLVAIIGRIHIHHFMQVHPIRVIAIIPSLALLGSIWLLPIILVRFFRLNLEDSEESCTIVLPFLSVRLSAVRGVKKNTTCILSTFSHPLV